MNHAWVINLEHQLACNSQYKKYCVWPYFWRWHAFVFREKYERWIFQIWKNYSKAKNNMSSLKTQSKNENILYTWMQIFSMAMLVLNVFQQEDLTVLVSVPSWAGAKVDLPSNKVISKIVRVNNICRLTFFK